MKVNLLPIGRVLAGLVPPAQAVFLATLAGIVLGTAVPLPFLGKP